MRGAFNNEKGIALIITLLVVTLLTALIVEFAYSARVNLSAAGNFRDKQKAYYLAKSGVNFIAGIMKQSISKDNANRADDLTKMSGTLPVGDGIITVKVFDESTKINIKKTNNAFINAKIKARLVCLFEKKGIDVNLADAIFEREPFGLVSELRLAEGMTDEVYDKVKDYITVYGVGNININTTIDAIVLKCQNEYITDDIAQRIIKQREKSRFEKKEELQNVVGISSDIYSKISSDIVTESDYFSVVSTGAVNEVDNTIEAVLERSGSGSNTKITKHYWRNQ